MSTSLVILEESSSYEGLVKSRVRWMPALRMMEDRVGYSFVMLAGTPLVAGDLTDAHYLPTPSLRAWVRRGPRGGADGDGALPLSP